jgi:hypothetical protein
MTKQHIKEQRTTTTGSREQHLVECYLATRKQYNETIEHISVKGCNLNGTAAKRRATKRRVSKRRATKRHATKRRLR